MRRGARSQARGNRSCLCMCLRCASCIRSASTRIDNSPGLCWRSAERERKGAATKRQAEASPAMCAAYAACRVLMPRTMPLCIASMRAACTGSIAGLRRFCVRLN